MDEIGELVAGLNNDEALVMMTPPDDPTANVVLKSTVKQLGELTEKPGSLYVVCLSIRPGWAYFIRHLELVHFPPMTKKNESLVLFWFNWRDMPFSMIGLPSEFRKDVEDSAKVTQMRLVDEALPMTPADGGWDRLPFYAPNVISLESERYSVLHKLGDQKAREWEREQIQKLEQEYL